MILSSGSAVLGTIAHALVGPRSIAGGLRTYSQLVGENRRVLGASAILILVIPVLAAPYGSPLWFIVYVSASTLCYLLLLVILQRWDALASRLFGVVERYSVPALAGLFLALAAATALIVLEDMPHISDEVVYQFQAKALAGGRLFLEPPPLSDFFTFVHTIVDGGKWYGILNPGWPLILGAGYLARVPWLVNPLLGALTLLVLFAFYRGAGYGVLESRLAVLLVGMSPFVFFMSSSYMAHPANLFLFVAFCWASVRLWASGKWIFAVVAGMTLGVNVLVRPVDAVAAALPFVVRLGVGVGRGRVRVQHLGAVIVLASVFAGATLLYDERLTGRYFEVPMSKYFKDEGLGKFGLGFGSDMGTKLHGPEWPGFYPSDALRVSSYRVSELLQDFSGLPWLLLGAGLLFVTRREEWREDWDATLMASGLTLGVVYGLHFYHGIAFGARHYYLAVPALAVVVARPFVRWISEGGEPVVRLAKLALVGLLLLTVFIPYPRLILRYGGQYRGGGAVLRDYVQEQRITNAVVFVESSNWGWKSAFPLNDYPLERNDLIFARDLGERNRLLMDHFPGRKFYHCRVLSSSKVDCRALLAGKGKA